MIAVQTKSVKMSFKPLYSYVLNTYYRSFSGFLGILLSIGSFVILGVFFSSLETGQKALFLVLGLAFTVINPFMLAFKTFKQLKLSVSYRKPLDYTFSDDGIKVAQGELSQEIKWSDICRIMMTNSMIAIYTSRVNAFVIPLTELGEEKGKIIASVVQFTASYNPVVSRSLKEYQSGKGL